MSDTGFTFKNIGSLQRNRAIEGETGAELGVGAGITLICLAATDANPRWRERGEKVRAELNRLSNARADNKRVREYLAGIYSECIVIGWYYTDPDAKRFVGPLDGDGQPIPFTVPACKSFLLQADDAYAAVDAIIYDTKNYRGARLEAVVENAGN